jgi:hypothetical protein
MSARLSPLAGVAGVVCMVIAMFIAGDTPDTQGTDAKITAYFASHSNQVKSMVGVLLFGVGVMFLIVFFWILRERLGRTGTLAFGAGVASAVLWLMAVVLFNGVAFATNDTSRFTLDPNMYRLLDDVGYAFWVSAVMTGAIVVWAASAAAAETLPRWFKRAGIGVGVIQLFAVFFFPAFLYAAWLLVASVLLARGERLSAAAVPQPA